MALTTVSNITVVTTSSFNTIRSGLMDLMVTAYGSSLISSPITDQSNLIKAVDWQILANDLQRVRVHQQGSTQTFTIGYPQEGQTVSRDFTNEVITSVNLAFENSTTVSTSQLGSIPVSSQRTSVWGTEIKHTVEYTWGDLNQSRYFFNLGSYIAFSLDSTLPGSPSSNDSTWSTLIAAANSKFSNFKYGWSQWTDASSLLYARDSGSSLTWSSDISSTVVSSAGNQIYVKAERAGSKVTFTVGLIPSVSPIDLNVTSSLTAWYSRGDVFVGGFNGIAAPLPGISTSQTFETGGSVVPPFIPTRILSVNSLSPFTFNKGQTSPTQTVTLTNNGNSSLTVTGITYTETGGVTAVGQYPWTPAFPKTINSGTSVSYTIAYTGNTLGTFNNSFTVFSNNDSGPVTRATQQVVTAVPFTFTLSPNSWSGATTIPNIVQQKFTIVPSDGSTIGTNYTASFTSGAIAPGFSVDTTVDGGPVVIYDPNVPGPGTLSPTLSVTCNGVTVTAAITVTVSAPANQHLGSWISPIQVNNSVVAMSYDIIGGQRYLTIAYGLGEDGSTSNIVDSSYKTFLTTSTLGISADTKFSSGVVVYTMANSLNHAQFIRDYGVWIRSSDIAPFDVNVVRSYTINVPTSGTYNWRMSCDNEAYFTINGDLVGDLRGYGNPWTYFIDGSVDLPAGQHTLVWTVKNFSSRSSDNPGGVAIQITRASDNLEIWNTRNAVRSSPAYRYWQEVYRIPIPTNGVSSTITSNPFRIKNSNKLNVGALGDFFAGSGGPFTVSSDGLGGLNIIFNFPVDFPSVTSSRNELLQFNNLPYYYADLTSRYENLQNDPIGDGTETTIFRGFNSNGSLRLGIAKYPFTVRGGGGGGGGGGSLIEENDQVNLL